MNPHDHAHALAKALRECPDCRELKEARQALKAEDSARNMLIDVRREQMALQRQQLSGVEIAPEQLEKVEKLLDVAGMNMNVKRYLQAEYRVAVLMQDIQKIIAEATEELFDPELAGLQGQEEDEEDS